MGADRDEISAGAGIIIRRQTSWFAFRQIHRSTSIHLIGDGLSTLESMIPKQAWNGKHKSAFTHPLSFIFTKENRVVGPIITLTDSNRAAIIKMEKGVAEKRLRPNLHFYFIAIEIVTWQSGGFCFLR